MTDDVHGTCKGCGAAVLWLRSPKGGKSKLNPIDVDPVPDGNLRIDLEHEAYFHIIDMSEVPENERYRSHFASCPQAAQFRRRR